MALMIPQSTHAQRAAYNAKHGAGAWAQKIGKPGTAPVGGVTPRPMAPGTPALPVPQQSATPQAAPSAVTPMAIPAAGVKATPHQLRATYNQKHGAGAAKGVSGHLLRQNYNQINGAGAAATGAVAQPAPAAPAAPAAPVDNIQTQPAEPGKVDPNDLANSLFPSTRMFEPENYEGSPLYQFQLKEGQKQVARSLAKRGLMNSGRGIEEELDVPMRAAAQDTDRMTRIASENAGRLERMQQNEALRQERAGNTQWDRSYSLAQLLAEQSPWQAAINGLDSTAGATQGMGQDQANWLKQYYQKVFGGGGSTQAPLSLPSGPDYSGIQGAEINGDSSSQNGWMNLLQKALQGIF